MGAECSNSLCMEKVNKGMCIERAKIGKLIQKNLD